MKDQKDQNPAGGDPVRNLWSEVIHSAILEEKRDNKKWFFVSRQSNFRWICSQLGFDAEKIKALVLAKISSQNKSGAQYGTNEVR